MNLELCLEFKNFLQYVNRLFVFQDLNVTNTLKHRGFSIKKPNQKLKCCVVQLIVLVKQKIKKDTDVYLSYFLFEALHWGNCVEELDIILLVCIGSW